MEGEGEEKHMVVDLLCCGACGVLSVQGDYLQAAVQTLWHQIRPTKSLRNNQRKCKAWDLQEEQ